MALPSNLTFAEMYERFPVETLFTTPKVETVSHDVRMADSPLFARMNAMAVVDEAGRGQLAGEIAAARMEG
ncbi:MAG TPA: hypothetical protein VFP91_03995 [Vicinamibacterales bacterium]|nr:hypothetical protein [Vicinamibacterales bacterium]